MLRHGDFGYECFGSLCSEPSIRGEGAEFTFRDRQAATPCFYSQKNKDQLLKGKLRVAFEGNISALPHLLIR